ncbi:unnamed protein product [Rhizophagus irregularis]|nr:unnamed protein product [Rhizophagus irregularis]
MRWSANATTIFTLPQGSQCAHSSGPPYGAQYRARYERPPFTTPGGPLTYGQTSRPTQRTAYMAPRPGYGIPLGGISLMAAPDSEVEKFIGGVSPGVTDDWMEKILKTVINYLIFWDGDFNEHYIIKLDSYEPWSFKRRRKYLEIAFEFILVLKALNIFRLVVLMAKINTDENTRKYLDQYEASRTVL